MAMTMTDHDTDNTGAQVARLRAGFNARRLRGRLAEEQITQTALARACGLSHEMVGLLVRGERRPGELACYKLRDGLRRLGLDPAMAFDPPADADTPA